MMKPTQFAANIARMRSPLVFIALAICCAASAFAQALPAAEAAPISTGFALPTSLGSLQYALTASQSFVWNYYGNSGASSSTNFSGDLAYLSNAKRYPFSLVLSGGHAFGESGEPPYNFVGLGVSQVVPIGRWNFLLSDNVSYLPGTASAGLSGVAGVGDLGVNPVQVAGDTTQGLLTDFSDRVTNIVAGSASRPLTGKTSFNAAGSYAITRFLDNTVTQSNVSGAGLDNDSVVGQGGISHQFDARDNLGVNYSYSTYQYTNNNFGIFAPGFSSQSASASYSHQFTRKLLVSLAAGPQWTTVETAVSVTSSSVFVDASASYTGKSATGSLTFVRSTNSGYGALGGALSDGAVFGISRGFDIVWNVAANSSFTRMSNLPAPGIPPFTSNTYTEGVQISRALMRSLSCFASYTFQDQFVKGTGAVDVYSGASNIVGIGITYSPSALHLGSQ